MLLARSHSEWSVNKGGYCIPQRWFFLPATHNGQIFKGSCQKRDNLDEAVQLTPWDVGHIGTVEGDAFQMGVEEKAEEG